MAITVHLAQFEGPLALLLYLIREQEMDIFDINIHQITTQYLEYIKSMKKLDLEVAGDFVAMASTLIQIKSRMLLPQHGEGEEAGEVVDPRKELVQKLLEYQKFQKLSKELYERPLLGRDVFTRGERTVIEASEEGEIQTDENPLFSLIKAYRSALKAMKKTVHRVSSELQSIAERILEMKDLLLVGQTRTFQELLPAHGEMKANVVLVTFLSLLELAKMGFVSLFQSETLADIHVQAKRPIEKDVVSQVESYDAVNAEETANALFSASARTTTTIELDEPEALQGDSETASLDLAEKIELIEADAATDEDILAEEQRLAEEDRKNEMGV